MYVAVVATLQSVIDSLGIAALPAKLQLLITKIAQIYDLVAIQNQTTRGKTDRRNELLQGMIDLALDVASAVTAYADEQRLTELAKNVDFSASTFDRQRIAHRPILAQQIHDAAEPVIAELAPYSVTAETLADLQAQIGIVKAWLDQPRSVIRSRAAATAQLAEAFRFADGLLEKQIDRRLFPLRNTNPEFYADYQRARQIWEAPGTNGATPAPTPASDSTASIAVSVPSKAA